MMSARRSYHNHETLLDCGKCLDDAHRRTILLALFYQRMRREKCRDFGYVLFQKKMSEEVLEDRIFKTFDTVRTWLESGGWSISWRNYHWVGYVEFVFDRLSPSIPQPGQIKNKRLLAEYMASSPNIEHSISEESRREILTMYQRIIDTKGTRGPRILEIA